MDKGVMIYWHIIKFCGKKGTEKRWMTSWESRKRFCLKKRNGKAYCTIIGRTHTKGNRQL